VNIGFGVASVQQLLFLLVTLAVFVLSLWALVDCLVRPARAFPTAGKRTRNFWLAITGGATLLAFLGLPPAGIQLLSLIAAVGAIVYLVDVRPAVKPYSGGRGGRGGGSSARGGW
jgi:uncharacterized membrane protein YgcG